MSLQQGINGALGAVSAAQGILGAASSISNLFSGNGQSGNAGANGWRSQLRQASFGGVPFGVLGGQLRVGRRNAVHEYPFKDQVWVEDLGRAARRITLTGFLVENAAYGGNPSVIAQRDRLIAVCESPDQKTLVHPTLGSLKVSLLDTAIEERWDQGRVFEISFSCVEAGSPVFPAVRVETGFRVTSAAQAVTAAISSDFVSSVTSALKQGSAVVGMAVSTAAAWAGTAQALARDATNLMNAVGSLTGSNGRYFGGRARGIGNLGGTLASASTTVSQLVAAGTVARSAVATATANLGAKAVAIAT